MVSIVITAYNVEKWIEQAVKSACRQTYSKLEIIVVEDCSTDNTRQVLSGIRDRRVKVIYNSCNIGAGASRRRGIEAANGEYILLLDGDDWLEKDFIEKAYRKAVESGADIVGGGIRIVNNDGSWDATSYGERTVTGKEKIVEFQNERILFMNNKLVHRKLHEAVPYCTRRFIEDTPVIISQIYLANKVAYIDTIGYNYRMHDDSLTHKASRFKYALFRALCLDDIIEFFEKNGNVMPEELELSTGYANCIQEIKQCSPTAKDIEPYLNEWIEFTTKLIKRLV